MTLRDDTIMEILETLDRIEEGGDHDVVRLRAHIHDDVLASMTPPQRELLERWHSYVCEKCGHRMIAKLPRKRRR